jgi:hypothetical protein
VIRIVTTKGTGPLGARCLVNRGTNFPLSSSRAAAPPTQLAWRKPRGPTALSQMSTGTCTGIWTLLPLRIGMLPLPTMFLRPGCSTRTPTTHDGDRCGGDGEHSGDTGFDLHVLILSSMIEFPGGGSVPDDWVDVPLGRLEQYQRHIDPVRSVTDPVTSGSRQDGGSASIGDGDRRKVRAARWVRG